VRRRGREGCQFIWGRRSGEALSCGRKGEVVHVELSLALDGRRELPLAAGQREGDFLLCRSHVCWLEREGAEIGGANGSSESCEWEF
jgi:hypothetical protein